MYEQKTRPVILLTGRVTSLFYYVSNRADHPMVLDVESAKVSNCLSGIPT